MTSQLDLKRDFEYKSFSGTDIVATMLITIPTKNGNIQKTITLGSLQTLSYSIHMDRKPVRSIGNINAKDYVMGPRTIAGTLVFTVFNKHFSKDITNFIKEETGLNYNLLADELPPFNVVISLGNEYGAKSRLAIYGIRLINEGQVMSINDIYTENTYQYVAVDLDYLTDENDYINRTLELSSDPILLMDDKNSKDTDNSVEKFTPFLTINPNGEIIKTKRQVFFDISDKNDSGKIKIYKEDKFILEDEFKENNKIYLLKEGNYSALYYTNSYELEAVSFSVEIQKNLKEELSFYVDIVLDTAIIIQINNIDLTLKAIVNTKEFKINQGRILIDKLNPNTEYTISIVGDNTKNYDFKIKTLKSLTYYFDELEEYIKTNKDLLNNFNLEDYINLINTVKREYFKWSLSLTPSSAMNLKMNEEKDILKVSMYEELIYILDSIYDKRQNRMSTVSAPLMLNKIIATFKIPQNISFLDIYENKGTGFVLKLSVPSSDIKNFNSYKFIGQNKKRYYIQAIYDNKKSERIEFNIFNDELKQTETNKEKELRDITNSLMIEAEALDDINKYIECAFLYNKRQINIFNYPIVTVNGDNIHISTHQLEYENINPINCYFVVAEISELLQKGMKSKKQGLHNEGVNFSINKNSIYACWIENDKFEIISHTKIFSYKDNEEIKKMESYYIQKQFNKIEEYFYLNKQRDIIMSHLKSTINEDIEDLNNIYLNGAEEIFKTLGASNLSYSLITDIINAKHDFEEKTSQNFITNFNIYKDKVSWTCSDNVHSANIIGLNPIIKNIEYKNIQSYSKSNEVTITELNNYSLFFIYFMSRDLTKQSNLMCFIKNNSAINQTIRR